MLLSCICNFWWQLFLLQGWLTSDGCHIQFLHILNRHGDSNPHSVPSIDGYIICRCKMLPSKAMENKEVLTECRLFPAHYLFLFLKYCVSWHFKADIDEKNFSRLTDRLDRSGHFSPLILSSIQQSRKMVLIRVQLPRSLSRGVQHHFLWCDDVMSCAEQFQWPSRDWWFYLIFHISMAVLVNSYKSMLSKR